MTQRHALVVDDSKSARFALRKQLETLGYSVDAAESLQQALMSLRGARPDIVFLDYVMPDVSGFDALEAIRRELGAQPCPVIMCTSSEGEEFGRQARAHGADDTLPKPPSPQRLADILASLNLLPAPLMAGAASGPPATVAMAAPAPTRGNEAPRDRLSKLDVVERHVRLLSGRVTQELATLRAMVGERDTAAEAGMAARIARSDERSEALGARMEDLGAAFGSLAARVDALREAMVAAPAERETPASPAIDALLTRLATIEQQHEQSRALLAERDRQLAAVAADCAELQSRVADLASRLDAADRRLALLDALAARIARMEQADGQLAAQARQQSALDQRLQVLERLAPGVAAIDAIGERLGDLEQSATRLAERLEQRLTALEQPRAPLSLETPATQTPAPLTERRGAGLAGGATVGRAAEEVAGPATVTTGFSGWLGHALRRKQRR
jgi:CheY-like chemotaxis protein